MKTLEDAWDWYASAREGAKLLRSLASYWNQFPWDQMPPRPDRLRHTEEVDLLEVGDKIESPLDDLAVLVLFSVFEAIVRDEVEAQLRPELDLLRHPALVKAGDETRKAIANGSFAQVLEPYKLGGNADLIEQVNQVRRYRNWVAHGRRPDMRPNAEVDPKSAYDRLSAFLKLFRGSDPAGP